MAYITIGRKIIEYTRVDSTNKKTRELNQEQSLEEGTIVMAFEQFAGKGYGTNLWESNPGENLTLSILLRPEFLPPHQQFWLTRVLSLAIKDTISQYINANQEVSVKWPNDIYVGDKKIAGILVENSIIGDTIKESICGIGLNVNQWEFTSDAPNPVSLKQLTGEHYDTDDILGQIVSNLTIWYERLHDGQFKLIEDTYRSSLYRLGIESNFLKGGIKFTGSLKGTDPMGRLLIETPEGIMNAFDFKEISFLV